MSRHTGIDPKTETFDISEHNLADKKYVDEQDNLRLELSGGQITGPLGVNNGKVWDLGAPTLDTNATNKKYVDDKIADQASRITTLAGTVSDKISNIDIVDESFTAGADIQIRVGSSTVGCHQNKLLSSYISNIVEKHIHLSYSGKATGFGITGGKQAYVWEGFNGIDGRCTFASIRLRGMGWSYITKIQLFSSDNTSGLSFASNPITDAKTGNHVNGTYIIPLVLIIIFRICHIWQCILRGKLNELQCILICMWI